MASSKGAAVDIGTNSVRLLISDEQGTELTRLMRITRLGQSVDQTGQLQPDAMERTLDVLSGYGQMIRSAGVTRLRAVATSAARDARNRDEFFSRVQACLGIAPELLSGDDEARLSFRGATSSLQQIEPPFVVFDIGGGSTEFAQGRDHPAHFISTDVGCVRISERFLHDDPPTPEQIRAAEAEVQRWLEHVAERIPETRTAAHTWVGLAGTVTSVGAFVAGLDHYDPARTHGMPLTRPQVERAYSSLASSKLSEREEMLLEPQRAAVILGGLVVLVSIVRFFHLQRIIVSEHDILDGLAASLWSGE